MTPSSNKQYFYVEIYNNRMAKNKLQEEVIRVLNTLSKTVLEFEEWSEFLNCVEKLICALNSLHPRTTPVKMTMSSHNLFFNSGQDDVFLSLYFKQFDLSDDSDALDIILNTLFLYATR